MDRQHRRLFGALLLNFMVFGVTVTIYGAIVPTIIREFDWSYLSTGIVLSASALGYFVSSFVSGFFVERFGPKRAMLLGLSLQALGLMLFGAVSSVYYNLIATLLVGLGHGGTEVGTNFCVARMEKPGQSRLMNLMHGAFPVGAISGPVIVGWLLASGGSWQLMFRGMGILSIFIALGFALLSFQSVRDREEGESRRTEGAWTLFRNPLLIFLFLTIFLYVGSEIGVSSWVSEYYVKVFGATASAGAYMVSVFWAGVLVGRVGLYVLYHGTRQSEMLVILSLTALISLVASLLIGRADLARIGFLISGLGYSAIYPVVMAIAGLYFKKGQSVAIGFVSTGGGVGSFSFPFIMAAIANSYGIRNGFWFYTLTTLAMAVSSGAVLVLVGRRGPPGSSSQN